MHLPTLHHSGVSSRDLCELKWCVLLLVLAPLHCSLHALCFCVQLLTETSVSGTNSCLMWAVDIFPWRTPCCASPARKCLWCCSFLCLLLPELPCCCR